MAGTDPELTPPTSVVVDGVEDPIIGLNLSGFVVSRLMAAGGMALVYCAEHETIGRRAAVKVLKPEVAADTEWTRRFLSEARALASLKHRNLIEVLNFGKTPDGRQYLMMEFLEGEPLDAYMQRVGSVSPSIALSITEQVLNGLAEAHKKGVVHRDLKPSNVFLLREHNGELLVKVIDFGLARQEPVALLDAAVLLPRGADGSSLLAGTPEYIAPEQALGQKVDGAADLYSLGVVLYEMLAGQLPFQSPNVPVLLQMHLSEAPPRLSSRVANLTDGLEAFVDSLLEKDPLRRPSSADAARVTVQKLLRRLASDATVVRGAPQEARPLVLPPQRDHGARGSLTSKVIRQASRQRVRWTLGVGAVVVGVLIGLLWPVSQPVTVVAAPVAVPVPADAPKAAVAAEVSPPTPSPEPAADEALSPLPRLKPAPAAAATPTTVRPRSQVVVEAPHCVATDEWHQYVSNELSRLGTRAAQQHMDPVFERYEKRIGDHRRVTTAGDCARVSQALRELQRALQASDE